MTPPACAQRSRPAELLSARGVDKTFRNARAGPGAPSIIRAVTALDLVLGEGRALGMVGESGSGKTTSARMLIGALPPTAGTVLHRGRPVPSMRGTELRRFRQRVQMVVQDPHGSLNPRHSVAESLALPLARLCGMQRRDRRARIGDLLELVALSADLVERRPHELSGGQCQRVAIARALAPRPEVLILDEPLSALDVSIQAQILALLEDLRSRLRLSYLFISHDLAVVERLCDDVVVMRAGRIVEQGPCRQVLAQPRHRYTRLLRDTARATIARP